MAQLFRQSRELIDVRACNLGAILQEDRITLAESEFDEPGYTACLLRCGAQAGILIPRNTRSGRRRFSIGHELGHFHIPSHSREGESMSCLDADLRARSTDVRRKEWEANDFATELLMPFRLFAADIKEREISLATALEMASPNMYDVSLLASTWRMVQTTRQAAAMVVSTSGRVDWIVKSDGFKLWLPERLQILSHDSIAAAAFRRETVSDRPEVVPIEAWVNASDRCDGVLLESASAIESRNQVVSLLWYTEGNDVD